MSDPLSMSLDEIIKSKKKDKNKGGANTFSGRGRGAKSNFRFRGNRRSPQRYFKGRFNNNNNPGPSGQNNRVDRVPRNKGVKNISTRGIRSYSNRFRGTNRNSSSYVKSRANTKQQPVITKKFRQKNRSARRSGNLEFVNSNFAQSSPGFKRNKFNRSPKKNVTIKQQIATFKKNLKSLKTNKMSAKNNFALKSVKKARLVLYNKNKSIAKPLVSSGRIMISKFGLITTKRKNLTQQQLIMQEKIQRAQRARENPALSRFESRSLKKNKVLRRRQLVELEEEVPNRPGPSHFPRPSFSYESQYAHNSSRNLRAQEEEEWIPPVIRISNPQSNYQQSPYVPEGLDPAIQRRIRFIQSHGRSKSGIRNEGLDTYDYNEESLRQFRSICPSSGIPLSLRFMDYANNQ